ncbi:cell division protein FtsL [Falsiroseomonas sp. E2-1-a4]|uniref:cell division protein FtsL n=1 Tax=Falsiroseomonas sp. E2-1-a4 TaxID=3239299 RepID=UPI003F3D1E47
MIRPFTILCFCAFAGAGAWLYQVKHQVATQDRELREVWRQIEQARDRTSILRAEWALLNEPGRLREVAQRHLPLEQMQPQQFTRLPDMFRRLPQAVAFAGPPNLFVPERPAQDAPEASVMLAAAQTRAPAPAPAVAAATPAPSPRAVAPRPPVQTAEAVRAEEEAPAPQALAATMAAQRAVPQRATPPVPARAAPLRDATPSAPVVRAAAPARTVRPAIHVAPVPSAPPIRTTQAAPAAPTYVSALGGATSLGIGRPMLAPPVPFSSSAAAATLNQGGLAPPSAR